MKFYLQFKSFHSRKCIWKYRLHNGDHFFSRPQCVKYQSQSQKSDLESNVSIRMVGLFKLYRLWLKSDILEFTCTNHYPIHCTDNLLCGYAIRIVAEKAGSLTPSPFPLHWRHNERGGVSNHRRLYWSMKISKLRVTGLCEGNSPVVGEFPAQRARSAENVSIWWRHHV